MEAAAREAHARTVEALSEADQAHLIRLLRRVVAGHDDVAAAQLEARQADLARQLVQGRLDAEHDLAQAVAAEGAAGRVVRVDRLGVDPLGRAAVDGHRLVHAVVHDAGAVVAVRPGVA